MHMTFTTSEQLPAAEATLRQKRCRQILQKMHPQASGLLVFSRTALYWLTGTLGNGMLWLPLQGEPVLLVRKGAERCRLESPLHHIHAFKSYGEVADVCAAAGSLMGDVVAAEKSALPWSLANLMQSRIQSCSFVSGDAVLDKAQAVKSPWELAKLEKAGLLHAQALHELLPQKMRVGMTERHIAHALWEICFALGHGGMIRMGHYGEEIFLGAVASGDNANYPSHFNGPVGFKGEHAAAPFMGYAGNVWCKGQPLLVDTGFVHEGYITDMTVTYFAGKAAVVPDALRRAHECCVEILHSLSADLKPGNPVAPLWRKASQMAQAQGFAEGFMGQGGNKVPFVGHGLGLVMDQWPAIGDVDVVLEDNMVIALEPKIALPGLGMAGLEEVFVVTALGGRCLTGGNTSLHCVEA